MVVVFDSSVVFVQPTSSALNISCGSDCSFMQQQRMTIHFQNSNLSSYSEVDSTSIDYSAIMSLPNSSIVHYENSFLNCNFRGVFNKLVLADTKQQRVSLSCERCKHSFQYALTLETLNLSNFRYALNPERQCQNTSSYDSLQFPYGFSFCSTVVRVSVGFWSRFSADGKLGNSTRCPKKYCGCKNVDRYDSCQQQPPFSLEFQRNFPISDDLCNGNKPSECCVAAAGRDLPNRWTDIHATAMTCACKTLHGRGW
jgi:hypothetical protein